MAVKNCGQCRLSEGQDQQPELYTVEASKPLDLVQYRYCKHGNYRACHEETNGPKGFGGDRSLHEICASLPSG